MLSPLQFPRSGKRIDRAPLAAVAPDLYPGAFLAIMSNQRNNEQRNENQATYRHGPRRRAHHHGRRNNPSVSKKSGLE